MAALAAFPVTSLVTGSLAVLQSVLGVRVGLMRRGTKTYYGQVVKKEPTDRELEFRVRAHQSLAENVPIYLLVLLGLEANQAMSRPALAAYGAVFVVLRVMHSLHLGAPLRWPANFRRVGYIGQLLLVTGGGILLATLGAKGVFA